MFSWFHTPYFGTVSLNNLYLDLFAQPSLYKVELKSIVLKNPTENKKDNLKKLNERIFKFSI